MIAKIFNTCSYLVTATNLTNEIDDENQLSAEEQMFSSLSEETKERMNLIKNSVIKLTDSVSIYILKYLIKLNLITIFIVI